ncbi:hypothetical protein PVAP13_5KG778500 [Panicum virgatum]|uniref:Coenzyme Q-binding protein COQ10 START domain-containing protein n=1 Tax=Panicum virgatum TaxID=38727 RepID=A0A8T0SVC1_PANVG|nr:hypothetical protein PVAP13_5KG778500 [Panicum virgatum]
MAACCCASSPRLFYSYRSSSSSPSRSRRRARLIVYPPSAVVAVAPAPRLSWRTLASPDPPPLADDRDDAIGFQIQVSKVGKRNRRVVRVDAPLEAVWATLTDYEGLADFIPGLSECRLLDQAHGFARIYLDLALGFKFNAKGTIDCYEGDMESLPAESRGGGGGAEGDRLQHDRRRFQALPGEMVRRPGTTPPGSGWTTSRFGF